MDSIIQLFNCIDQLQIFLEQENGLIRHHQISQVLSQREMKEKLWAIYQQTFETFINHTDVIKDMKQRALDRIQTLMKLAEENLQLISEIVVTFDRRIQIMTHLSVKKKLGTCSVYGRNGRLTQRASAAVPDPAQAMAINGNI